MPYSIWNMLRKVVTSACSGCRFLATQDTGEGEILMHFKRYLALEIHSAESSALQRQWPCLAGPNSLVLASPIPIGTSDFAPDSRQEPYQGILQDCRYHAPRTVSPAIHGGQLLRVEFVTAAGRDRGVPECCRGHSTGFVRMHSEIRQTLPTRRGRKGSLCDLLLPRPVADSGDSRPLPLYP